MFINPEFMEYFQGLYLDLKNGTLDENEYPTYGYEGGGYTSSIYTNQIKNTLISSGWKKNSLPKTLQGLNDRLLYGHHPITAIPGFTHAQYNSVGYQGSIYQTLLKLGIRKARAEEAENVISPLYNTCYTNDQLIHIAFEYLLGKYEQVMPKDAKFLTNHKENDWHAYKNTPYKILNIPFPCKSNFYDSIQKAINMIPYDKSNSRLFFHSTNWGGCQSIFQQILHTAGRKCLDFGYHPGFYLTPTFSVAVEWGEKHAKHNNDEVAIMVFILPNTFKKDVRYLELEGETWKRVVIRSRLCTTGIHEMEELRNIDIIYGPILKNPEEVIQSIKKPESLGNKKQLVSKTDMADKYLQNYLYGAFIFQKYFPINTQANG